jgi:hypothetical protein
MENDLRRWMRLVESEEFPSEISDVWLTSMAVNQDRDDLADGPVPKYIARYPRWVLTRLPIASVKHPVWDHDPDLADGCLQPVKAVKEFTTHTIMAHYASLKSHTAPPIIYPCRLRCSSTSDSFRNPKQTWPVSA